MELFIVICFVCYKSIAHKRDIYIIIHVVPLIKRKAFDPSVIIVMYKKSLGYQYSSRNIVGET